MRGWAEPGMKKVGRVPEDLALGCVFRHLQVTGYWRSSEGKCLNGRSVFREGCP